MIKLIIVSIRTSITLYLKRRQLAGEEKLVSEQISKTVYQFYKLH